MVLSDIDILIFNQLVKKKQANRTNYIKRFEVLKKAAGNCWWLTSYFNQNMRRNK